MSERIRGSYDDVLYKSTHTSIYFQGANDSQQQQLIHVLAVTCIGCHTQITWCSAL